MSRLTDNDRNWGPFTWGPWSRTFSAVLISGGEDEGCESKDTRNRLRLIGFGWVLQIMLPNIIRPWKQKQTAIGWDEATIKRMGRDWYYNVWPREYGFSLSNMGNGYDFLQLKLGTQTHDSRTTKDWCKHLPWKQWSHVRTSFYDIDGSPFWTQGPRSKGMSGFNDQWKAQERVPKAHFGFEDYDGEMIIASTYIEEMEWKFGTGWFKWLRFFRKSKVRRSLDLHFSAEVGPEKGSWKGGTTGHGIEMLDGELHEQAFRRYCATEHDARHGKKYRLRFIGPCGPPPVKVYPKEQESGSICANSVN